jgi:long-chain-fatty-acid--CoA ligase ACSBG
VLLSHDNYLYNVKYLLQLVDTSKLERKLLSYLPLSHVAGQASDVVGPMVIAGHVYFADPAALQGKLIDYLREVRPTILFSVPRVWEKIEEKMKLMAAENGFLKKKIAEWAKSIGVEGTYAELNGKQLPFGWSLAKSIVYDNVKKALGIDQVVYCIFGAAPLSPTIREYFMSLNIFLVCAFGMSECGGPQCFTEPKNFEKFDAEFFKEAGFSIEGTQLKIDNPDKEGNGEICFRGRNRFMGYFKNE